jgi:exonuclease VII large subunit
MLKLKAEQEEEDKLWKNLRREMFILEEVREHRNLTETEMRGLISLYNALIDKKKRELQELQPSPAKDVLQKDWERYMLKKDRLEKELQAFIDEEKNKYYFVSFKSGQLAFVTDTIDQHSLNDNSRYEKGNYFLTKEEAQQVAYLINYQFTQLNKPTRRPKK